MKPIVLHTGRSYSVEQRREREQAENYYRVERTGLVPPDELTARAKTKFEQIVELCFWLDNGSLDAITAYCQAWDRYMTVIETMKDTDDVVLQKNAKDEIVAKQNPYRYALKSYLTIMQEMSGKLGLYAVDRLKLSLPEVQKREENPFETFMEKVE